MALALRDDGQAGRRRDGRGTAALPAAVSRASTTSAIAPQRRRDGATRAIDHGVQLARSHGRRGPRPLAGAEHRSSHRQHALRRRSTGSTSRRPRARELVFTLIETLGRAAHDGRRDAHLSRAAHRHRVVSLLAHHAAQLRDRAALRRGRRRPAVDRAHALRQQHARRACRIFGAGAERHAARRRRAASRC